MGNKRSCKEQACCVIPKHPGHGCPCDPHRHGRSTARALHARNPAYISNAHTGGEGMAEALPGSFMLRRAADISKAHTGGESSEAMECLRPCGGL